MDTRSRNAARYRRWYKLAAWKRLRAWRLSEEPLCRTCSLQGRTTPANTVDHIDPHKGDWDKFIDRENTQSLCPTCHSAHKQAEEGRGYSSAIGADGWPTDERHPMNRSKR